MTKLTILSADDKLAEIRRLYFAATKRTITDDLARAVQLLKSMSSEDERQRAAVYMDGLAQMRSDWAKDKTDSGKPGAARRPGAAGGPGAPDRKRKSKPSKT